MQSKLRDLLKFCGEFEPTVDDGGGSMITSVLPVEGGGREGGGGGSEGGSGGAEAKQPDPRSEYVYIYWDIENVSIPGTLNPKKGEPQVN